MTFPSWGTEKSNLKQIEYGVPIDFFFDFIYFGYVICLLNSGGYNIVFHGHSSGVTISRNFLHDGDGAISLSGITTFFSFFFFFFNAPT